MNSSRRVASLISSVMQSMAFINPIWDALTSTEQDELRTRWAALIEADPQTAPDRIAQDIALHPQLRVGWFRFGPNGPPQHRVIFANLIKEYGPAAEADAGDA